ncbi:MAG: cyclohexanone monooxygenase [Alphaproteobacteria bacterium]|nr:cyclohexanone monooxygenase [Alphaproteobacteria bacterium]|tara:strand:- start:3243 stop:4853 length:1611 start_codon:yes stop_codon:yes gene_type:complete
MLKQKPVYDAIVVGAGFAGMYMLYRLRERGMRVRVFETGTSVGGTWYWNRYPGARVDTETMFYSYQFSEELQQEWNWPERYPAQLDLAAYARHVADRFELWPDIQFETRVSAAAWGEDQCLWTVQTEDGDGAQSSVAARYCIMATGCLSAVNYPKFEGLSDFAGETFHTAHWPEAGADFTGKRVAVIGTGSSGVQSIPVMAEQAAHLHVFQRTANYVIPARNRPLEPDEVAEIKANYPALRAQAKKSFSGNDFPVAGPSALAVSEEERNREYEARWTAGGLSIMATYADFQTSEAANETASEFVRGKIRQIVDDPAVAELLAPKQLFMCKRLCVGTDYYETYNRDNVTLVDISETPIERITPEGVSVEGRVYEVDVLVLATGFDAVTGALKRIDISGVDDITLREKWEDGPKAYLGLGISGFPNMFTITGPGSPSVLTNMIPSIEQHVEWITGCIDHMRDNGKTRIEAEREAEAAWVQHVNEVGDLSLRANCQSWYFGSNIPGKPRVVLPYSGGFPVYARKCEDVAAKGYEGFSLN